MLYVTTRNQHDFFTAHHSLREDRAADGGFYIPFQNISFDSATIKALRDKPFNQCVVDVLNLFFSARLSPLDIDFAVGRYPVRLVPMSHKIMIAELWNNQDRLFSRTAHDIINRIIKNAENKEVSNWAYIAVRIAFLVGIFSDLQRFGIVDSRRTIDISVPGGNFSAFMAVCYARRMGLPIGKIIVSDDEFGLLWELLHNGTVTFNSSKLNIPENLERFIYSALGAEETNRFVLAQQNRRIYTVTDDESAILNDGLFSAVISQKRALRVINNVYRTSGYVLHPESALAYGGLQDYRATEAEAGPALILTEKGPHCDVETVATAIGISASELKERINT